MFAVSLFYLVLLLILLLLLIFLSFLSKSELFINSEILDLLTNFLFFIFASSISFVHFITIRLVKYLPSVSDIVVLQSVFLVRSLTLGISFWTALRAAVEA